MMLQKKNAPRRSLAIGGAAALSLIFIAAVLFGQRKKPAQHVNTQQADTTHAVTKLIQHMSPWQVDTTHAVTKARSAPYKSGETKIMEDGTIAYTLVDKMPAFNGDISSWMSDHLIYPDSARARGEEGRCVVQFVIDAGGNTTRVHVLRSSGHPLLDEAASQTVQQMPRWKPGTQEGQFVAVLYTLPIAFKLD